MIPVKEFECKSVEYGSITGMYCQFNKIGDSNWYYVEFGDLLAVNIFFDLIKLYNGKPLKTKLF